MRVLVFGFAATVVLTTLLAASQRMRLTRMNLPYLLGTMFTARRDRAKGVGIVVHLINGWIFAAVYTAALLRWPGASWWHGGVIGLVHAAFVLVVGMPLLPSLHPRMASEEHGPTPTRQLEPPGFFARHYGSATAWSVLLAHVVYGGVVGAFCVP